MCLIVVAVRATSQYTLVVAANRDEQHARPAASAAWWPEPPRMLGGRDLEAGGTWLAVDRRGRFAAVTNIRDAARPAGLRSRGSLVTDYLARAESAGEYAARVGRGGAELGAFNLLIYDGRELWFASNRAAEAPLPAGLHSFSNAAAGVEWPKIASARAGVERLLSRPSAVAPQMSRKIAPAFAALPPSLAVGRKIAPAFAALPPSLAVDSLFALLAERDDSSSPEQRYERTHFVVGATYGTRCSTVLLIDNAGRAVFAERSFDAAGRQIGEARESFVLEP
jgi:uncharacterized protein with NRDE domain